MDEFISHLKTLLIDVPYLREIALVLLSVFLTHFFETSKLKKEQRIKFQETLGEKIAASLTAVRELVLKTKSIEAYDFESCQADDINAFKQFLLYPAFMNDGETLGNMFSEVLAARKTHEAYLDLKSAAYLYIFEKYLTDLALYIGQNNLQGGIDRLGLLIIIDVQKWESAFDKHLVNQINHPHYKLFTRHGWRWNLMKWLIEREFMQKSILNKLMQNNLKGLPFDPKIVCATPDKSDLEREEVHA